MNYIKHFTKYFIPGKHNQYKPHFFRFKAVFATAGIIAFFFLTAAALNNLVIRSGSSLLGAVVSSTLVELANADRESNNLHGLLVSPVLEHAAQLKANDMARLGYFAHNSPDGLTPWHWFEEAGYGFSFAGENLAVYFSDSTELEHAWMNSPLHRANILNSYFTEIGIATAKGVYQGRETVYVVQEFGRPSRRVASVAGKKPNVAPLTVSTTTSLMPLTEGKKTSGALMVVKGVAVEAEPLKVLVKEDTFIAVQRSEKNEAETVSPILAEGKSATGTSVALAGTTVPALLKVAASPWTLLRTIYTFFSVFIAFALLLMVGIEIKHQHPLHIFYGVSLLVFMGVLFYFGTGFFFGKLLVL